nr:ADP-ribosyl cyclase/cyclic ADP-ribose hydrolase 1-like [Mirounga angustirostris]
MANHRFSSVSEEEPCCNISKKTQICLCVFFGLLIAVIIAVPVGILMRRPPPKQWKGEGTTAHLSEILLGRCYTYTQVVRPELGTSETRGAEQ